MKIGREFHYDSAHYLPYVPEGHKCGRMHGHTYRLIVEIKGPVRPDGFVMDFAEVDAAVDPVIKQLDHYLLNHIEGLRNPTVEVQLRWLWERLDLPLKRLTLFEGLSNFGIYEGG